MSLQISSLAVDPFWKWPICLTFLGLLSWHFAVEGRLSPAMWGGCGEDQKKSACYFCPLHFKEFETLHLKRGHKLEICQLRKQHMSGELQEMAGLCFTEGPSAVALSLKVRVTLQ